MRKNSERWLLRILFREKTVMSRKKSLRETDYWRYSFNKYCRSIDKAPAHIRRTWNIAGIQHNAAEFADTMRKRHGETKPAIMFDELGVPRVKGKEVRW